MKPIIGQTLLNEVERSLDECNEARPKGMPTLDMIRTELARFGFGLSDAEDVYDRWLINAYRTKTGPIKDWKAALRVMMRHGWLPSQQLPPPGLVEHKRTKPLQLSEAARDRRQFDLKRLSERVSPPCQGKDTAQGVQCDLSDPEEVAGQGREISKALKEWREQNR
jgi:hypothetical protein